MKVLDASALLAFFLKEPGAEAVKAALEEGAVCGAANYSEFAQKTLRGGRDWPSARVLLDAYHLQIEPVTREDAEWAARR
ncbi:MAG: PIN domain-containing protein, partial [Bifidobacteriaceae bacterium]|nr:PIN domain-containing protein [Bifidobacteriaceae bacterium]